MTEEPGIYSVGDVAGCAGVTIRTLHHYDEIGLLSPNARSAAGYRQYQDADLDRLQRILFYRELGFSLDQIATILDDPEADADEHMDRQRRLLLERIGRLEALVAAIDRTKEARRMGTRLTPEDKLEIFGGWTPPEGYSDQAEAHWSGTDAWKREHAERSSWTKQDWQQVEDRREDLARRLQAAFDTGIGAASDQAMALARELCASLPPEYAGQIVDRYVTEPETFGFVVRPEEQRPGMAEFVRQAVRAQQAHKLD